MPCGHFTHAKSLIPKPPKVTIETLTCGGGRRCPWLGLVPWLKWADREALRLVSGHPSRAMSTFLPPYPLGVALEWTWGYMEEGVGVHDGVCSPFSPAVPGHSLGPCLARGCPEGVLSSSPRGRTVWWENKLCNSVRRHTICAKLPRHHMSQLSRGTVSPKAGQMRACSQRDTVHTRAHHVTANDFPLQQFLRTPVPGHTPAAAPPASTRREKSHLRSRAFQSESSHT